MCIFNSGFVKLYCLVYHLSPAWFLSQKYCEYPYFYDFFTFEPTFHTWNGDCKIRKVFLTMLCISLSFKKVKESEVAQSCLTLCNLMDCSLPGFSIHGIFQARILEWVAISFSKRSSWPRDWTQVSCIVGRCFTVWAIRKGYWQVCRVSTMSCMRSSFNK